MTATPQSIGCPICTRSLPPDTWNLDYETYCPTCRNPVTVLAFPALFRPEAGAAAEAAIEGEEATCFYHSRKKAMAACDQCGRFVCALCRVELSGQNWCPACVERHRSEGRLANLDSKRTLWDNIALALALGPLVLIFFWFLSILTAPAALFIVIRHWRTPLSLVPRTRVRFVIAAAIAVADLAGWGFLVYALVLAIRSRLS